MTDEIGLTEEKPEPKKYAFGKNGKIEAVLMFDTEPDIAMFGDQYDAVYDMEAIEGAKPGPGWTVEGETFIKPVEPEKPKSKKDALLDMVKNIDLVELDKTDIGKALLVVMCAVLDVDKSKLIGKGGA